MKIGKNQRGFATSEFSDRYDVKCSIQKSSLAFEDCIWLGVDEADPKIMASDALKLGIKTDARVGWIPYPVPDQVLINTRMHLTREQVAELIPVLQRFVDTGEL